MGFLDRIADCNSHDLSRFVPWSIEGRRVGYVHRDRFASLLEPGMPFAHDADGLVLDAVNEVDARSAALAVAVAMLADREAIRAVTGELYPVVARVREPALGLIDRSALSFFGLPSTGVHMNGFVRKPDGSIEMWIAERAAGRTTFPGALDNMVAGGQPHDLGLLDNLIKECDEEASIPREIAGQAKAVGTVSYVVEHESGLKPDTMFCFDLELPDDFEPRCRDGEVESFMLMPIEEVAAIVSGSQYFKFNCNLVIIDFMLRHGLLDVDEPEFAAIAAGLHQFLAD